MVRPRKVAGGAPKLGATDRVARRASPPWSDMELGHSVEAYLMLLRLQSAGVGHGEAVAQALLSWHLDRRNDAAIRYRMRNISAVLSKLGLPTLDYFSPAKQVGKGVEARIQAILQARREADTSIAIQPRSGAIARSEALSALAALRAEIEEIEHDILQIGHNGPPEPIGSAIPDKRAFTDAISDVVSLEEQLNRTDPSADSVNAINSRLLRFGISIAKWSGERVTKFADAAMVALAPALVIKALGLMPAIVNAVELATKAVAR